MTTVSTLNDLPLTVTQAKFILYSIWFEHVMFLKPNNNDSYNHLLHLNITLYFIMNDSITPLIRKMC